MDTEKEIRDLQFAFSMQHQRAEHQRVMRNACAATFLAGIGMGFLIALFTASFWLKIAVLVLR